MTRAWVYMLSNRPGGVLYTGMCNADLRRRMWEHRQSGGSSFADKYNCKRLVWFAAFSDVTAAAEHERRMKRWKRAWKVELIEQANPDWRDLYSEISG
ncbi:GIY-YIG nuclease family protein [Oceanicaulis alexandrii]|uniref:GIY-YIG nuclease family protein n=1 Tax=Oceanicaulis alexandrii TaxID=153233 RepID=UPI0003B56921|nr:GIY-YIG nuclease family protein [Oceanicaulis alexandrii]VXC75383.1 conserved hypothetical protein [Oceanicaulis sp. 350]|tara:strand:- start:249 stop:542 length:294 start_codon:yes stop_codon:yes gene_type:complete